MSQYPVDPSVLKAALDSFIPGGDWLVVNGTVYLANLCAATFTPTHGGPSSEPSLEVSRKTRDHVAWLLKLRLREDLAGWMSLSDNQRIAKIRTHRESLDIDDINGFSVWPSRSRTGAEYVEACAWYDRVEAELADEKAMPPPFPVINALRDELEAVSEWSGSWNVKSDGWLYCNEVAVMSPDGIVQITKSRYQTFGWLTKVLRDNPELDQRKPVESAGHKPRIEPGNYSAGTKTDGPPEYAEQPWEKQARDAASAGYAHTQPAPTLSGTHSINGWAVSGFAVTDAGFAQTYGSRRDCRAATQGDATAMLRKHARGQR